MQYIKFLIIYTAKHYVGILDVDRNVLFLKHQHILLIAVLVTTMANNIF